MPVRRALGLAAAFSLALSAGGCAIVNKTSGAKKSALRTSVSSVQNSPTTRKAVSGAACVAAATVFCALKGRRIRQALKLANSGTEMFTTWAGSHSAMAKNAVATTSARLHLREIGGDVKVGAGWIGGKVNEGIGDGFKDLGKGVLKVLGAERVVRSAKDEFFGDKHKSKNSHPESTTQQLVAQGSPSAGR